MEPFRIKYLDYVKSEPILTDNGLKYHVKFAEHEGSPHIGWAEKFMGRDFGIGANVGGLIGTVCLWSSAAAAGTSVAAVTSAAITFAPLALGLTLIGGAIGGISDYMRHNDQMENGLNIGKASYFNRDMAIGGLSMSSSFGMVASIGMMGLAVLGASVAPFAVAINAAAFAGGLIYGGINGAKEGYSQMDAEYIAAQQKYKNPEYKVALSQKRETQFDEVISSEASIATTILPMVIPALAQTETPTNAIKLTNKVHEAPLSHMVDTRVLV